MHDFTFKLQLRFYGLLLFIIVLWNESPYIRILTTFILLKGAITTEEKLTEIGKTLSKLPVDILLGKMLIMGSLFDQVEAVLSLASALSVQSPFTNRAFRDIDLQVSYKNESNLIVV